MPLAPYDSLSTSQAIRAAAADLFYRDGYEATTLRQVADAVGIKVGSLYNHIKGKDDLLAEMMLSVMDGIEAAVHAAVEGLPDDPTLRFIRVFEAHIRFHAEHSRASFVGNSELRSLKGETLSTVLARRAKYEVFFRNLVADMGARTNAVVIDPQLQTYVLLAMGHHVASWYRPDGPRCLEEIIEVYVQLALRQLGVDAAVAGSARQGAAACHSPELPT